MKVVMQPDLADNKTFKAVVEAATPILEEAIGEPASRATAMWSCRWDDEGRTRLRLTLSDGASQVASEFAPEELQPPEKVKRRLIRLWGDLLEVAFRRQMQALEASLVEAEAS